MRVINEQNCGKAAALLGAFLTRAITPEQINANRGAGFLPRRVGEVREIDLEARTVSLAWSSEQPVDRWFGEEILSHEDGAIRLDRMQQGAALLINHDWGDQVGVVEAVSIDTDRRGRAVVRFGKSARASEILQDVADGIRRHISVGYMVHKVEVETRKGAPDLVRVTDWEPYEISIVSVPADPTVGIGRQVENSPEDAPANTGQAAEIRQKPEQKSGARSHKMKFRTFRDAAGNLCRVALNEAGADVGEIEIVERAGVGDVAAAQRAATETERARVRSIMEMGEQYGAPDLARDAAKDGKSPEEFQRALLVHLNASRGGRDLNDAGASAIGMTDKEAGQFSFVRAIRALANPTDVGMQKAAAFEFEASRAAADKLGKDPKGILIPSDVLTRAISTSASASGAGNTGGYTVATDLLSQSFVEMLRNRATIMSLGTSMGGLVGNVEVPRQASGATGYWQGEDAAAAESNLEFDQIGMTPKTVAALSEITRKLLMQSSLDVEALVRRDLATALALTIDLAGYYGTGSANQPRGIVNYSGINAVDFGAALDLPTYAQVVQMETEIAADNADVNSMAYVGNARMRGHLKTTQKFSGTDGSPIWEPGDTVNGYRTEITNQIANGDLIFGNFADLIVGMWGGLEVTVDPYTHSARGRLRIVAMQDIDLVLRRVQSFCLGRGVE